MTLEGVKLSAHESAPTPEKNGENKEPISENHLDSIRIPADICIASKEKGHELVTYDPLTTESNMGEDTMEDASIDTGHIPSPAVYWTEEVDDSNTDPTNEAHDHLAEYGHKPHRSILLLEE